MDKSPSPPPSNGTLKVLWVALALVGAATLGSFLIPSRPDAPVTRLDPALGIQNREALESMTLRPQEDHPVDDSMRAAAKSLDSQVAPPLDLPGADGKQYSLESLTERGPLLIFFVEKDCPCCLGAKYFVDKMAELYEDELTTIAVINAEQKEAEAWIKTTEAKWPVLLDPKMTAIQNYKAERGVYTTLVGKNQRIIKAFPGYSKAMLDDLNKLIAQEAGIPARTYKALGIPDEEISGCMFPTPETPNP